MKRLVVAVAVAAVFGTLVAAGGTGVNAATANTTANNTTTNTSDAGFGASVSAFMATSAADANGSVDQGMWEAGMNRTPAAERATARVRALQSRLDRLSERRQALLAAHRNDSISDVAFRAQMAAIASRYERLATSANATRRVSRAHNVTPPGLDTLVANATAAARSTHMPPGLSDRKNTTWPPRSGTPGGPPNGATPGNATAGRGNGNSQSGGHGPGHVTTGNGTTGAANATGNATATTGHGPSNTGPGRPTTSGQNASHGGANGTTGPSQGTADGGPNSHGNVTTGGGAVVGWLAADG